MRKIVLYIRNYFDLNKRSFRMAGIPRRGGGGGGGGSGIPQLILSKGPKLSTKQQIIMYAGVFFGVVFSEAIFQLGSESTFRLSITVGKIVVDSVIALLIIPNVYKSLQLYSDTPFIVQLGIFVQNGVFWHVVISAGRVI